MDQLSDKGRRLIDDAMAHDEPPPVDQSWGTLVVRLTEEAPQGRAPVDERAAPAKRWIWIALVVAVIAAVVVAWPSSEEAPAPAVTAERVPIAVPAKAPLPTKVEPPSEQLLVDAEAALAANDPDRAMLLLQRHAERAAIDPQATRRMALRVLVLCAQGEQDLARDEAKAFLAAHAQSQWSDAVRRSCAAPQ